MSQALVRTGRKNFRSLYSGITMRSTLDEKLRQNLSEMEKNREQMAHLDEYIRKTLKFPSGKNRNFLVRLIGSVMPSIFYEKMPERWIKTVAEEQTVLDLIELRFKTIVNNAQATAIKQAEVTSEMTAKIDQIRADLDQARSEQWDARRLHEYSLQLAEIEVEQEISRLLDSKFSILTPEEKENRRQALLQGLEETIIAGEKWARLGGTGCYACLEQFESLGLAFGRYILFQKPAAAFRDTAKALVSADNVMHQSRDAIEATVRLSVSVIETSLENMRATSNYSLVSADMVRLIETGNQRIDAKLRALESDRQKNTLNKIQSSAKALKPAEVIDVQSSVV